MDKLLVKLKIGASACICVGKKAIFVMNCMLQHVFCPVRYHGNASQAKIIVVLIIFYYTEYLYILFNLMFPIKATHYLTSFTMSSVLTLSLIIIKTTIAHYLVTYSVQCRDKAIYSIVHRVNNIYCL